VGEFPGFATYGDYEANNESFCGGALIYEDVILSAAHCSIGAETVGTNIYIGGTRLDHSDAETRRITAVRLHPNYNDETTENDYMLMKLDRASGQPALPYNTDSSFPSTGTVVTVVGFGLTQENGSVSQRLLKVNVIVDKFSTCDAGESHLSCYGCTTFVLILNVQNNNCSLRRFSGNGVTHLR
jgi:secreted trypsin-like serine protease